MARISGFIPSQSSRFADDFEVYVDYGKGRPVKMNQNEAIFADVEKFLTKHNDPSKMITNQKSDRTIKTDTANHHRNSDVHEWTTCSKECTPYKSIYDPTLTPHYLQRDSSSSTFPSKSKINCDESWLSNKPYNTRVTASINQIPRKTCLKTEPIFTEHQLPRTITYQTSKRQITHEGIYPKRMERKLYLNMAVNGASKSMREHVPLSNLNLKNGDFGDDAGMFTENRDFCLFGLADGASGNRSLGINPADFSQAILAACRDIFHQNHPLSNQLSRMLISAIKQVQTREVRGSSTLCLLALDKQEHRLTTLNIGDSGFVIYRNNKLYHRSTCTMNADGCGPKQLLALDNSFGLPCFLDEKEILQDCSLDNIQVQKDDIIILSSDGLWDVIKGNQLQKIIQDNANKHLQNLADDLLNEAVDGYVVNNRDDILIIVCRVEES